MFQKPKHKKRRVAKCPPKFPKECYITGATTGLHKHHIYGGANRKLSEIYGLYVWLIPKYHNMSNDGVHFNKKLDTELKRLGQMKFEQTGNREEFVRIFNKNYL